MSAPTVCVGWEVAYSTWLSYFREKYTLALQWTWDGDWRDFCKTNCPSVLQLPCPVRKMPLWSRQVGTRWQLRCQWKSRKYWRTHRSSTLSSRPVESRQTTTLLALSLTSAYFLQKLKLQVIFAFEHISSHLWGKLLVYKQDFEQGMSKDYFGYPTI